MKNILLALTILILSTQAFSYNSGIGYDFKQYRVYKCNYSIDGEDVGAGDYQISALLGTKNQKLVVFKYFGQHTIGHSLIPSASLQEAFLKKGVNIESADNIPRAQSRLPEVSQVLNSEPSFNLQAVISEINQSIAAYDPAANMISVGRVQMSHSTHLLASKDENHLQVELSYKVDKHDGQGAVNLLVIKGDCSL